VPVLIGGLFGVDVAVERDVGKDDGARFECLVKLPQRNEPCLLVTDVELFESCFSMVEARSP